MAAWDFNAAPFEWVFYHPPKSRAFGHGSRFRDRAKTWATTKAFLANFTDASEPKKIEVACRAPSRWLSAEVAARRYVEAKAAFGAPTREDQINGAHWDIEVDSLEDAVAFEVSAPKSEKNTLPPSWTRVDYRFLWRTPWDVKGGGGLRESHLALDFSGGSILIQPWFVFLASIQSSAFREQLAAIEPVVPFKFNDAYFKRWLITPSRGNAGRYLKPEKGWRAKWMVS